MEMETQALPTKEQIESWVQEIKDTYRDSSPDLTVDVIFNHIDQLINDAGFSPRLHLPEGILAENWGVLYSVVYVESFLMEEK